MILVTRGIVKGVRVCTPLTSASEYDRLGAARRAGAGACCPEDCPLEGLDIFRVRLYSKGVKQNMHEAVQQLDDLVIGAQNLADLYVQCLDRNPDASVEKPHDREMVESLFQALAGFYLAKLRAVSAVAAYVSGSLDTDGRDF